MKTTNVPPLAISFILFLLSISIMCVNAEYVCLSLQYEGANPFHKEEFKDNVSAMEKAFYDDISSTYNKALDCVWGNYRDNISALYQRDALALCRCVYEAMTKIPNIGQDGDTAQINSGDIYFDENGENGSKRIPISLQSVRNIKCNIHTVSFSLLEGYRPTLYCFTCHDMYVQLHDASKKEGDPEFVGGVRVGSNEPSKLIDASKKEGDPKLVGGVSVSSNEPAKLIGRVFSVNFRRIGHKSNDNWWWLPRPLY